MPNPMVSGKPRFCLPGIKNRAIAPMMPPNTIQLIMS